MNNIFKSALLLACAGLMFTACSDDRDSNPTLQSPETFVLNTPAYAAQAIDLENSMTVNLTWSQPDYGFPAATDYSIELSATNEWTVSNEQEAADETGETQCNYYIVENTYNVCNAEIDATIVAQALQLMKKYKEDAVPESQEVYARVKAQTTGSKQITSNVVKFLVKPYYIELKPAAPVLWYLVGNCIADGSWGNSTVGTNLLPMLPMPDATFDGNGNGTLVYAGYFPAGGQFKFVKIPGKWDDQMNYTNMENPDASIVSDEDGDNHNVGIINDGYYLITMNTMAGTFTVEKYDGTPKTFTGIYLPGAYNGWDAAGNALTGAATNGANECHDWLTTLTLDDASELKFAANGNWDVNWGATALPYGYGTQGGANINVPAGQYTIYFNDILGLYYFIAAE